MSEGVLIVWNVRRRMRECDRGLFEVARGYVSRVYWCVRGCVGVSEDVLVRQPFSSSRHTCTMISDSLNGRINRLFRTEIGRRTAVGIATFRRGGRCSGG